MTFQKLKRNKVLNRVLEIDNHTRIVIFSYDIDFWFISDSVGEKKYIMQLINDDNITRQDIESFFQAFVLIFVLFCFETRMLHFV